MIPNQAQKPKAVTGTDADLRTLTKETIHEMLRKSTKMDEEIIKQTSRWEGVNILKQKFNQAAESGVSGEFSKFSRGNRITSKMQRENYQKKVNSIFKTQIKALSSANPPIDSDSEDENHQLKSKDLKNVALGDLQQTIDRMDEYSRVMSKEHVETDIDAEGSLSMEVPKDIMAADFTSVPNYQKLIVRPKKKRDEYEDEKPYEVQVLKKVIKLRDEDGNERHKVILTSDPRVVKSFLKRMKKYKQKFKDGQRRPPHEE